ncbi:MAG: hypothetical protein KME05_21615 [Gloeocapsa sp. UFS-A4-WI-NPMV-4B04]|jgi:hypothetical protein|nr:hypothetical protein [Gloeocapsa sp. UFS-A4-WI-NPMV-4B04]
MFYPTENRYKCENTHTDNSKATPLHHSVVAPEVWNGSEQELLPTPEIQEKLIDTSTAGDDTPLMSLEDDKAHSFFDIN